MWRVIPLDLLADWKVTLGCMPPKPLTIGPLAQRSGFPPRTIRYYESIGLLPAPRRSEGGYRLYEPGDASRLAFIARAKRLGLSLDEISEILTLRDAGREACVHVLGLVDRQIDRVDEAMVQHAAFRRQLRRLRREAAERSDGGPSICRIVEHAALETSALDLPALTPRRAPKGALK